MKKILALMLVLVMCFTLFGCNSGKSDTKETEEKKESVTETTAPIEETDPPATDPAETDPPESDPLTTEPAPEGATPLLYKVTDEEGNVAWLFGSIHLGIEDYYPLPDYVMDAFYGSDALAVEFDIIAAEENAMALSNMVYSMIYMDGSEISDHIPEELYEKAVEIMDEYMGYSSMYDMFYPVIWWQLLSNVLYELTNANSDLGVDRHMIELAYDADMPVLDVESAELQFEIFANFSEPLQILLLESTVEAFEDTDLYVEEMDKMIEIWMQGDEEAFRELLREENDQEMTAEEQALYEEYKYVLETSRNVGMADFVVDALESGDEVFVCVGAAHIVSDDALVDMLREMGYTVEQVH